MSQCDVLKVFVERRKHHEIISQCYGIITLILFDGEKIQCFIFKRGTCLYMSGLCCTCQTERQMKRWANQRRQQCVCADGRHLLWPPWAPFWIPIYFGKQYSFLPRTSPVSLQIKTLIWCILFMAPGGLDFFSTLCLQVRCCGSRELWSIKLKDVLAGIDVLGLQPLTLQNKTPDRRTMWTLHVVKIMKFDS